MSERLTLAATAAWLREQNDVAILLHRFPDGDTIGSGFGLCRALQAIGKRARVLCADPIPAKFDYLSCGEAQDFEPAVYVAVDVATPRLLGSLEPLADRIALCIDHHGTNTDYAARLLLDDGCTATAMLIAALVPLLGAPMDTPTAECLYTGISTDSGCFKYSNTTAATHRMAADLLECGVRAAMINRLMFDTKSRARIELERQALDGIRFFFDGRVAVITVTTAMIESSGATDDDLEGLTPVSRQIEGVWVGITLRQKKDGAFKVSVRTDTEANAAAICGQLGGGGHPCAAGCEPEGTADEIIARLLEAVKTAVPQIV